MHANKGKNLQTIVKDILRDIFLLAESPQDRVSCV